MKPQDTVFFFLLVGLILVRKPRLFLVSGLVCWVLSIPLFAKWIFLPLNGSPGTEWHLYSYIC